MFNKFFNYIIILIFSIIIFTSCNLENTTIESDGELAAENIVTSKWSTNPHEQNEFETINRVLNGLKKEKIGHVFKYLANNIEWTFAGEISDIPFAGTYIGKKQVNKCLKTFFSMLKIETLIIENTITEGENIISHTRLQGSIPLTKKTFDMEYVFTWELNRRKKIDKCSITYNTYSLGLALSSIGAGHIIAETTVSPEAQFFYFYYMTYFKEWFSTATVEEIRAAESPFFPSWPADAEVEAVSIAGMDGTRVNVPPNVENDKIILYIHGGGFISGEKELSLMLPYQLSKNTQIPVLTINYNLAPENPFPAAPENCYAVYKELLNTYESENIAIIGESAGGNLVLTTALLAKERNLPLPGALVPLSPWLNLTNSGGTFVSNEAVDSNLSFGYLNNAANCYLQGSSPMNPIASPIFAEINGDFPPVFFTASTCEMLLGDSVEMYNKLSAAGIDVTIELLDGLVHGWPTGVGLAIECDRSVLRISDFINVRLKI